MFSGCDSGLVVARNRDCSRSFHRHDNSIVVVKEGDDYPNRRMRRLCVRVVAAAASPRDHGGTIWSRFIAQQLSTEERRSPNGHSSFPGEFVICVTPRDFFRRRVRKSDARKKQVPFLENFSAPGRTDARGAWTCCMVLCVWDRLEEQVLSREADAGGEK